MPVRRKRCAGTARAGERQRHALREGSARGGAGEIDGGRKISGCSALREQGWQRAVRSATTVGQGSRSVALCRESGDSGTVSALRQRGGCGRRASKGQLGSENGFCRPSISFPYFYMCFSSL